MKRVDLSLPEFLFIVGTRAALGAGLGLLGSQRMSRSARHCIAVTLVVVGVLTTIPAAILVFGNRTDRAKKTATVV